MSKKIDYGKKYECFKCGCKFYDLNKPKAVCPKCRSEQPDELSGGKGKLSKYVIDKIALADARFFDRKDIDAEDDLFDEGSDHEVEENISHGAVENDNINSSTESSTSFNESEDIEE